jgi:hypothetical protein
MVIEVADLAAIADDEDAVLTGDITFPDPVVSDPELARAFLAMHHASGLSTASNATSTSANGCGQ